jgi:queuine tRNA-ribosyltransferase
MLLTWHNLHYYQDIMRGLRGAIESGSLDPGSPLRGEQAWGDPIAGACPTRP